MELPSGFVVFESDVHDVFARNNLAVDIFIKVQSIFDYKIAAIVVNLVVEGALALVVFEIRIGIASLALTLVIKLQATFYLAFW